jgi:hypothetical protein
VALFEGFRQTDERFRIEAEGTGMDLDDFFGL